MKRLIVCIFILFSFSGLAHKITIDCEIAPVGDFQITSDSIFGKIIKDIESSTIVANKLQIPLSSLKSGIPLRDEHIHKYLIENKISKNKNIEVFDLKLFLNEKKRDYAYIYIGTKKQKIFLKKQDQKDFWKIMTKISLKKLKLETPSFMNISVKDTLEISVLLNKKDIR